MKSILLYGTLIILSAYVTIQTFLIYNDDKLKREKVFAQSDLRQMYNCTINYLYENEERNKMPTHKDFHKILERQSYEPWVLEKFPNEVHIYYSPGIKLDEVQPEKFIFSFRDIYMKWDGTFKDFSK